ncbi:MAG: sulfatase [Candidatus Eisenbacteria bacterium]
MVLALTLLTCGNERRGFNVVLVGIDTLRANQLGCYGYHRDTSPNIDRFAESGVLFLDAVSSSPWTLPAFATVFTSLYPSQHGANSVESVMRTSFPTLAEVLGAHGYSTGAIVNAPILSHEFGVGRGFDHYDVAVRDARLADSTTTDALRWIDEHRDGPFFIFVHYFDPHLAYAPPAPFDTLFDPGYRGALGSSFDRAQTVDARESDFESLRQLSDRDRNHIVSLYDGEIAFTDAAVGRLLAGIGSRDLTEDTLILLLSDHGEEFLEHDGFAHGHTLFDELLKVPLIFSLPGVLPGRARRTRQVRLVDVTPTILDILEIDAPPHAEGVSILPDLLGRNVPVEATNAYLPKEAGYCESLMYGTEKKGVRFYPSKLIYDETTAQTMLFDLRDDPGELEDLSGTSGENHRGILENMLFRVMLGTTDTWYVQMGADDDGDTFDVTVSTARSPVVARIYLHKILDAGGCLTDRLQTVTTVATESELNIRWQGSGQPLTLAFKVEPAQAPVEFNFRIDSVPAMQSTFLGPGLLQTDRMPFTQRGGRAAEGLRGRPDRRPEPPYVLVWQSRSRFGGHTKVRLNEQTKADLKALGYIH